MIDNIFKKTLMPVVCSCIVIAVTFGVFQYAVSNTPDIQTEESINTEQSSQGEEESIFYPPDNIQTMIPDNIIWGDDEKETDDVYYFGEVVLGNELKRIMEDAGEDDYIGFRIGIYAVNYNGISSVIGEISEEEINILKEMGIYDELKTSVELYNEQYNKRTDNKGNFLYEYRKRFALFDDYRKQYQNILSERNDLLQKELTYALYNYGLSSSEYKEIIKKQREHSRLSLMLDYTRKFSNIRERNIRLKEFGIIPYYDTDLLYDEVIKLVMELSFDNSDPSYNDKIKRISNIIKNADVYIASKEIIINLEDKITGKECLVLLSKKEKMLE